MVKFRSIIIFVLLFLSANPVWAMANANMHLVGIPESDIGGLKDLLRSPANEGGAAGLTREQLLKQSNYIDDYATKLGKLKNQKTGGPMSTQNHGALRHNPEAVSKSLSGNGTVNLARKNVTRLHKIQDVYYNSARSNIDGWHPTNRMKSEATRVLKYVKRHGRLPKDMPFWVDNAGPYLKGVKGAPTIAKAFEGSHSKLRLSKAEKIKVQELLDLTYGKKTLKTKLLTPRMRDNMHEVLEYVHRNGKLPGNVPSWLDDAISPSSLIKSSTRYSGQNISVKSSTQRMPKLNIDRFRSKPLTNVLRGPAPSPRFPRWQRMQAVKELNYIARTGTASKHIPTWIDDIGERLLKSRPIPRDAVVPRSARVIPRNSRWSSRLAGFGGRTGRALGIATVCAFVALDGYIVVNECRQIDLQMWDGFITPEQGYRLKGEAIGSRVGMHVFGFIGFGIGSCIVPGNVIVGAALGLVAAEIGGRVGGWAGDKLGSLWAKIHEEEDRIYYSTRRKTTEYYIANAGTHHIPAKVYRQLGFAPEICNAIATAQTNTVQRYRIPTTDEASQIARKPLTAMTSE